jgi:hypothetical protein
MKRVCNTENKIIDIVLDNCKKYLEERDTIYLKDICILLEKALEGIENKKDLVCSEQEDIKRIRNMIKGL